MNEKNISWKVDRDLKFKNSDLYKKCVLNDTSVGECKTEDQIEVNNTQWLYQSYPEAITKEKGVTDEHFIGKLSSPINGFLTSPRIARTHSPSTLVHPLNSMDENGCFTKFS